MLCVGKLASDRVAQFFALNSHRCFNFWRSSGTKNVTNGLRPYRKKAFVLTHDHSKASRLMSRDIRLKVKTHCALSLVKKEFMQYTRGNVMFI